MDHDPLISNLQEQLKHLETRLINNDREQGKKREVHGRRMEGLKSALKEISAFEREMISNAE